MRDFKILKFLDRFKNFFEKLGVDYNVMRKILQVKFIMDNRRVPIIINNSSKKKNNDKDENKFNKSLLFYGFIGMFIAPIVLMGENFVFQMSFVFGILMFMIMTSLISDFSAVLLDVRDKNIISSKPVNSKTLSMAKIIHVLTYMFLITISLSGAGLLAALIKHGVLFFVIFLLEIILMDLFIVVLTTLLYLIIRMFFKFASNIMKNEREFKLKVYPSLGFALIFPFIFIFNELKDLGWNGVASSKMYLNIYFCALLIPTIVMMMKYSVKYKGAWVYKAIPIESVAAIFRGTLKAFIVRLVSPVYIVECIIFMFIFGVRILPDLIVVFLIILFFTVICFVTMKKSLPFSQSFGIAEQSEGLIVIPLMLLLGVMVGIYYACTLVNYGVYAYIVVIAIVDMFTWKKAFNVLLEKLD